MFSKTPSDSPQITPSSPRSDGLPSTEASIQALRRAGQKLSSLIANDMTLEGNITGGGELQIDGVIKGDVRVERVTVSDGGQVEGGIFADSVEVHGKVSGSITAKQVRLFDACHMDGDVTHEQLSVESGAFFQGKSLRLQKSATSTQPSQAPSQPAIASHRSDTGQSLTQKDAAVPVKDSANGQSPKASPTL